MGEPTTIDNGNDDDQNDSSNTAATVVPAIPAVDQFLSTPDQVVPNVPDTNYPAVLGFTAPDPGLPKS